MKKFRYIQLGLLIMFFQSISASSIYYPWTLKLDNGIKIKSVAYRTYDTYDPGKTWVYKNGELLYTLDRYLTGCILTNSNGEFLVEINFNVQVLMHEETTNYNDENGNLIQRTEMKCNAFKGDAINVFKKGVLIHKFDFKDLHIDTTFIKKECFWNYSEFYWGTVNESLLLPNRAFVKNDTLHITTIDKQELLISLSDTSLISIKMTENRIREISKLKIKRKFSIQTKGLPEQFCLPRLENGKSLERELANYLNYTPSGSDSAIVDIYIHTLLIDKNGVCIESYVSPMTRNDIKIDFRYIEDKELKGEIEKWLKKQKYKIDKIPSYSDKYGFSGCIYLKKKKSG